MTDWSVESWKTRMREEQFRYPDRTAVDAAVARLRTLPPLVTSWEIERLRQELADAEQGRRFLLQGGDCAERLDECGPATIANKLKILLQMSLVLVHGARTPVIRVGRFAGQYAKPRSSPEETRDIDGKPVTLPSYFGDLVNRAEFTADARRPDPALMLEGYQHAAMTLNFVRSLTEGGFADLHHPEYWNLSFFHGDDLSAEKRDEYERMSESLASALRFMEALGDKTVDELTRVEFFTSHEGLNLLYESSQTRTVPRRDGFYDLTTHMPWIGERTRGLDGAHVEFFRGIRNPVGVKLGPRTTPEEVVALSNVLNPDNGRGKLLFIARMGAGRVLDGLTPLLEAMRDAGRNVLWVCDPMHGNGSMTPSGRKTRSFDAILQEVEECFEAHANAGTHLGGVHFELTGDDVTECVGGASGLTESALETNYTSLCDPRLNYEQALEMAFLLAGRMGRSRTAGGGGET